MSTDIPDSQVNSHHPPGSETAHPLHTQSPPPPARGIHALIIPLTHSFFFLTVLTDIFSVTHFMGRSKSQAYCICTDANILTYKHKLHFANENYLNVKIVNPGSYVSFQQAVILEAPGYGTEMQLWKM